MDVELFTKVAGLSAFAVVAVQQLLKLKFIPLSFANKYPVPTVILLSIAASIIAVTQDFVQPSAWTEWVLLVGTIIVVAAITYNATLRNWTQLREMEGQ